MGFFQRPGFFISIIISEILFQVPLHIFKKKKKIPTEIKYVYLPHMIYLVANNIQINIMASEILDTQNKKMIGSIVPSSILSETN